MSPRDPVLELWAALGWQTPPERAEEALTHRSFANERRGRGRRGPAGSAQAGVEAAEGEPPAPRGLLQDNQRLEFLGDAVLGLCVSERLVAAFPEAAEGELSRMRASLVKTESLAAFGRRVGLPEALRLGRGASASGEGQQMNVIADAVEALVAAAYLDGGLSRADALVQRIVGEDLHGLAPELRGRDPKSELQERVQGRGAAAPVYRLSASEGPDHDRWFEVEVLVEEQVIGRGRGRSKKLAEQEAARAALKNPTDLPMPRPLRLLLLALSVLLLAAAAHAGSYLDRAAMLLTEARRSNEWVMAHLGDKELAAMAREVAEGRVKAARNMQVPKEVAGVHPHLLLTLENTERAAAAAADGDNDRFMHHVRIARDEDSVFRSILAQQNLKLPELR